MTWPLLNFPKELNIFKAYIKTPSSTNETDLKNAIRIPMWFPSFELILLIFISK